MTNVQLPDDAVDALAEIAKARGYEDDLGKALAEAISVERQIAASVTAGATVVVTQRGKQPYELVFPRVK